RQQHREGINKVLEHRVEVTRDPREVHPLVRRQDHPPVSPHPIGRGLAQLDAGLATVFFQPYQYICSLFSHGGFPPTHRSFAPGKKRETCLWFRALKAVSPSARGPPRRPAGAKTPFARFLA